MLKLDNISVNYKGCAALSSISVEFAANKISVVIGPSGCGKSTLLRLASGLVKADSGDVLVEGEKLDTSNISKLRHRMGYVIQNGGLFPHLSVRDNVIMMASYLKWPVTKIDTRLNELAELVQIEPELFSRYPGQLSGGQKQRVSLMRALFLNPSLLLLDEPLGALDPMIRFELQLQLKEIFDRLNTTVIMVTHDLAEAAFFAHQLILMREGKLIQKGSLRELTTSPAESFVEKFINAQRQPMEIFNEALLS